MYSKRIIAIMAAAIMLLCPVAVICAETEADSNAVVPSYFSSVEGKDYNTVKAVYNVPAEGSIASLIGFDFYKDSNGDSDFTADLEITNLKVISGLTAKQENLDLKGKQIWSVSYDFKLTLTSKADNAKFKVTEKGFYSGEGYDLLKSYLGKTFAKGDKMVFEGNLEMKTAGENSINLFKRDDGYVYKNVDMEMLLNEEIEYTATFNDENKELEVLDSIKTDIHMYGEIPNYEKTKSADKYKYKNQSIDFKTYETSMTVMEDGNVKKVNIDMEKMTEAMTKSLEGGSFTVLTQADYDKLTSINQLPQLTETYQKKSASDIENALKELGKYSTEKSDFDKEYNSINNSINSSGTDDTWIWVGIAIAIAVIAIIAIALQFFDVKKPKA